MSKVAIVVHGGASIETPDLKNHLSENEAGLKEAIDAGYRVLSRGGTALKAVEEAVMLLEDNPLFNAGRGSCLNKMGEIEMDASIMDGKTLKAGAASMVRSVKNPIMLARTIMVETNHVFLSGYGALEFAKDRFLPLESDAYFVADHQLKEFQKNTQGNSKKIHGTVGAVAVDRKGNIAAGTSTGGLSRSLPGRIGDSCVIGAGCYANNKTCAVSGTGDGEYLIRGVVAHTISMLVSLKKMRLQEACDLVIHKPNKLIKGEMGVIAINKRGQIAISFNTAIMRRAWKITGEKTQIKIYK